MAFPQGIDFRNTSGYVSDPTNCDYEIGSTNNYPRTTAQGNTVGWESGAAFNLNRRNRNSGIDARLAGLHFLSGLSGNVYRIDLPSAGSYDVRIAAGDATYANNCAWDLQDTSTLLTSLTTGATTVGGRWKDATNTQYTAANWVSSNTPYAATFSTTIMRVVSTNNSASISHLHVAAAGGGTNTYTLAVSGGFSLGGTAQYNRVRNSQVSAGISFAGSSPLARTRVAQISGGVTFGGSAPITFVPFSGVTYTLAVSGGFSLGGTAPYNRVRVQPVSAGVNFGGTAQYSRVRISQISGGVTFGGTNSIIFIPAGGAINIPQRTIVGAGT